MHRTKSSAQSTLSKPVSITSQFRFEKVEQLTNFINEAVDTPTSKNNVGQKVLEMLKTQIRTNYDQLYENYGDNKKKILKHIQAVETNIAGQNAMNSRFDQLVKEKSKYDRLHADICDKQRKLKKLNEIKQKLNNQLNSNSKAETKAEDNIKLANFEEQRKELEHQASVLKEMLSTRQRFQLSLREKQLSLNEQITHNKEKLTRFAKENEKRVILHKKLTAEIQQDEQVEIPLKLAEELSQKMEMYENKHSYNSIIGHEAVLEEKRFTKLKDGVRQQRQQQRVQKLKRQAEQKSQLEQLYNIAQIKVIQEQKLKKYCAVETIQQIYDANKLLKTDDIDKLSLQIEHQIEQLERQNIQLEQRIEDEIISQSENPNRQNIYDMELQLNKQQKQKQQLNDALNKWQANTYNWKIILGLLELESNPSSLTAFLASIDQDLRNKSTSDSRANATQTLIKLPFDQLE